MPRLALLNMLIGFVLMSLAAAAGGIVAYDVGTAFTADKAILETWQHLLNRSAHGHTNLFGMLHILFGITLPYSTLSTRVKGLQTVGILLGACAMSLGLIWRGALGPSTSVGLNDVLVGGFLSASLLAMSSHAYGIFLKWLRTGS